MRIIQYQPLRAPVWIASALCGNQPVVLVCLRPNRLPERATPTYAQPAKAGFVARRPLGANSIRPRCPTILQQIARDPPAHAPALPNYSAANSPRSSPSCTRPSVCLRHAVAPIWYDMQYRKQSWQRSLFWKVADVWRHFPALLPWPWSAFPCCWPRVADSHPHLLRRRLPQGARARQRPHSPMSLSALPTRMASVPATPTGSTGRWISPLILGRASTSSILASRARPCPPRCRMRSPSRSRSSPRSSPSGSPSTTLSIRSRWQPIRPICASC